MCIRDSVDGGCVPGALLHFATTESLPISKVIKPAITNLVEFCWKILEKLPSMQTIEAIM